MSEQKSGDLAPMSVGRSRGRKEFLSHALTIGVHRPDLLPACPDGAHYNKAGMQAQANAFLQGEV